MSLKPAWRRILRLLALAVALGISAPALRAEAPPILLANVYRQDIDVSQYLISEKLDGVRAIWDGEQLRFRSGNTIKAPAWFIDGLPKQPLDGELWIARGRFERVSATVRRDVPDDAEWREVRYMIFELPGAAGTFRERAGLIQKVARDANAPWLRGVEQYTVPDQQALQRQLDQIISVGGEGLMLHRADAPYETGRSDTLLKLKPFLDTEATVIGHLPGKGKYTGQLGALRVQMPDGRTFSLGTGFTDEQRRNPPPIGARVTYRYRDLTVKGMPRFASFLRIREDK